MADTSIQCFLKMKGKSLLVKHVNVLQWVAPACECAWSILYLNITSERHKIHMLRQGQQPQNWFSGCLKIFFFFQCQAARVLVTACPERFSIHTKSSGNISFPICFVSQCCAAWCLIGLRWWLSRYCLTADKLPLHAT
jgi:hypothetical protein